MRQLDGDRPQALEGSIGKTQCHRVHVAQAWLDLLLDHNLHIWYKLSLILNVNFILDVLSVLTNFKMEEIRLGFVLFT